MTKTIPLTRAALIAAALSACTTVTATAEEAFSPYISVFAGLGILGDETFSGVVTPPGGEQSVTGDFGSAFNFGAAVGVELGSTLGFVSPRVEIEGSYLSAGVGEDTLNFSGNGPANEINVDGGISRALLLANLLLDVETGGPFTPYVGVGAGLAFTNSDVVYGGPPGGPAAVRFDDSGVDFAAQLIAGASYEVSDNVLLFADGRYTRVFGFDGDRFNPAGLTGNISGDVDNVSVNVGVRYRF
ncbi:MAG: outer membrane beta-barrel protein [Pseudomonadota bacterium]